MMIRKFAASIFAAFLCLGAANAQVAATSPYAPQTQFAPGVNFNDQSSVAGNLPSFYYPTYFTNPGTAVINKFNRLQVGLEALSTPDIIAGNAQTTQSWVAGLVTVMSSSQIAVTNTIGSAAIAGASRTSDFRTAYATATGGTGTVVAISDSDDSGSISCAFCSYQFQEVGITGISLSQIDMNNRGSVLALTPHGGIPSGSTIGLDITAGAKGTVANPNNNASAALVIGEGKNNNVAGPAWEVGQLFLYRALDTSIGSGGNGVAIEYYTGQSQRWLNSSDAVIGEIWADATGIHNNGAPSFFGTSTTPTEVAGQGSLSGTSTEGLIVAGSGSGKDVTLKNASNQTAFYVLHGSQTSVANSTFLAVGAITAKNGTACPAGGTNFYLIGSTANFGIYCGTGVPTVSAAQGSIYLRSDGSSISNRFYINTDGSTTWTSAVTGA